MASLTKNVVFSIQYSVFSIQYSVFSGQEGKGVDGRWQVADASRQSQSIGRFSNIQMR
jgi:hypothetical protein